MSALSRHGGLISFRHFLPSLALSRVPGGSYRHPWLSGQGGGGGGGGGQQQRHLFTPAALGLDQYLRQRQETSGRFEGIQGAFKERMRKLLAEQGGAIIFTEDFKNTLHLAEDSTEDLEMIREMACRFNRQHEGLRFGMYVFGPVVMRTYHTLKQPQEAFEAISDPKLEGFFDQLTSYQVCMDLLFKVGRYGEVREVFEAVQDKRISGHRYPKNCFNLAVAACYKEGTQDSHTELQALLAKAQEYGININRRLLVFGAALALRTANPHTALDLALRSTAVTHISVRSVKVMALSQLDRVKEALMALRAITEIDLPRPPAGNQGKYILQEAVEEVEAAVRRSGGGNKEVEVEFERLKKILVERKFISEKSLDEIACTPIDRFEQRPGQERAMLQAAFNTTTPRQHHQHHRRRHQHHHHQSPPGTSSSSSYRPPRRQGLMDME